MTYADSYARLIARHYDALNETLRGASRDAAFYLELARASGGPVLELGCGTGRVLLPIAREGIACVGLDASLDMLAMLRAKRPPPNLELVHGDMAAFDLGARRFALITVPFRALSHLLDVPAQLAALANARRHLAPGGRLALDVFDPKLARTAIAEEPEELAVSANTPRGRLQRFDRVSRDLARQVLTLRVRFVADAPEDCGEGELQLRWFHRYELEHLLARAGFAIEALYGGFDRSPWTPGGETIVIARAD
ncbi:MAG TPA: class I SAM-dependent methyltransferase [Myxococcota bacterium]